MISVELSEGISETLDILNHMKISDTDKIPDKFKDFLEKNKSQTYIPNLDHSKKINEMNLKKKTKDILAVIYMNYWCDNEKKIKFKNKIQDNEKKYQEELRNKYNPDNLFKNKRDSISKIKTESEIEQVELVEYKESKWYQKVFAKILNIFK